MRRNKTKIVICVNHISQNKGGLAAIARLTAREFGREGCDVVVLTRIDDGKFSASNVRVVARPSVWRTFITILNADYVICEGAAIRLCWPLLLVWKKSIVVKHGVRVANSMHDFFEKILSLHCHWAAVSRFVADKERIPTVVVPNALDPTIFYRGNGVRPYDLIYVGSLTKEKGIFLLAKAVVNVLESGVRINRVTFVGEGADRADLVRGLSDIDRYGCSVAFTGNLPQPQVADLMRQHRVSVAPTIIPEAFGLVAIEGLACGCRVIVSDSGGLPEAVGKCGVVFPREDVAALADCIRKELIGGREASLDVLQKHLDQYLPDRLVRVYMGVMDDAF